MIFLRAAATLALTTSCCAVAASFPGAPRSDTGCSAESDETTMLSVMRVRTNVSVDKVSPSPAPNTSAKLAELKKAVGSKGSLVLVAWIYGASYIRQPSFKQFLGSAKGCGANVIIAGDRVPKAVSLPDNVANYEISWDQLADALEHHFNDGKPLTGFRHLSPSERGPKISELRPLTALLLPEQVSGYDWWGWVDVDMWLGGVTKQLNLQNADSDFWSPVLYLHDGKKFSLGPFSIMRNVHKMNTLLKQPAYRSIVKFVLEQPNSVNFDEWGENYDGSTKNRFSQSFSYILQDASSTGSIKISDWLGDFETRTGWDGHCSGGGDLDPNCGFCQLTVSADGRSVIRSRDGVEMLFCHMEFGKLLPGFQRGCSASLGRYPLTYTFRAGILPSHTNGSAAGAAAALRVRSRLGIAWGALKSQLARGGGLASDIFLVLVFILMAVGVAKLATMIHMDLPRDGERKFEYGKTDAVYPSRLNFLHKTLTVAMTIAGLLYFAYLWTHRRHDQPILAGLICFSEGFCVFVSIITRFQMWHRQRRVVCRLDGLRPEFPKVDWPKVELLWTHYLEPPELSRDPLEYALNIDYPHDKLVLTIGDDGYHVRRKGASGPPSPDQYEVTEIGLEMEQVIRKTLSGRLRAGEEITETRHVVQAKEHRKDGRPEGAPGGLTIVEFRGPGLPLVKLVGRMKGEVTFSRAGNIENGVWNSLEADAQFMALLDVDMKPEPAFMQVMLAPFFQLSQDSGGKAAQDTRKANVSARWEPNWKVGWTSSPQFFDNIEAIYGAEDPLNQANKLYWQIYPAASDNEGLVHFWGTNAIFFVPALKDSGGFIYGCITEDNATSYAMHQMGWSSIFVNQRLAIGLSRETVTESFDQRKRWLMGNIQQLMAGWDIPFMHKSFRDAPYRKSNRHRLRDLRVEDQLAPDGQSIAPDDAGAAFRRNRRVGWGWRAKLELHYVSTKFSFAFVVQPIWLYTLTLVLMCRERFPINVDHTPLFDHFHAIKLYHIVVVYTVVAYISQVVYCSDNIADANNPYTFGLQLWRDPFTYSWVRVLGAIDGVISAYTGKQLKWNVYGAVNETNLAFALPNLCAWFALAVVVVHAAMQLTVVDRVHAEPVMARILFASLIMFMMMPVVTCILAEMLKVPYYVMRNVTVECLAMFFMVGLCMVWLNLKVNEVST